MTGEELYAQEWEESMPQWPDLLPSIRDGWERIAALVDPVRVPELEDEPDEPDEPEPVVDET